MDIGGLPSIAFGDMEVLREGAAAQNGPHAIADVLDPTLWESASAFDALVRRGSYGAGDHEATIAEATGGLPFGRRGFLTSGPQVAAPKAPAVPTSVTDRVETCCRRLLLRREFDQVLLHPQVELI